VLVLVFYLCPSCLRVVAKHNFNMILRATCFDPLKGHHQAIEEALQLHKCTLT
jgi:hypothetical protein